MSFYYTVYGLIIESYLPLPELVSTREDLVIRPDVVIKRGQCDIPEDAVLNERYAHHSNGVDTYYWRGVGSFNLRVNEITVQTEQGVADILLRFLLLGPLLVRVLNLRGRLVLHCSAVSMSNRNGVQGAVAFLGHSRAGKSTIAAALKKQGHDVVADDMLAIPVPAGPGEDLPPGFSQASGPVHIPLGPPYLKLRHPALENFGEPPEKLTRWHPDADSYLLPHETQATTLLPLHSLYLLESAEQIGIERLEPQEAVIALANHSFGLSREVIGQHNIRNFFQCSWLTTQVPIFRLQRPHDFSLLTTVTERIKAHQLSL